MNKTQSLFARPDEVVDVFMGEVIAIGRIVRVRD
jgi:hypothetical protein